MNPFPPAESADEFGLLAVGGDLRPATLLLAYRQGIFPWFDEGWPVHWWSPDPRGIFELDSFHVSRRLARTLRSGRFRVTFDRDFESVMSACGERREGTWITASMLKAYVELHRLGHAHSVEVWRDDRLVGGVYGVAINGLFAAESMFYRERDASKVALAHLVERLRRQRYALFDIQMVTEHTGSLGAIEISRQEYLRRLAGAVGLPVHFHEKHVIDSVPRSEKP